MTRKTKEKVAKKEGERCVKNDRLKDRDIEHWRVIKRIKRQKDKRQRV